MNAAVEGQNVIKMGLKRTYPNISLVRPGLVDCLVEGGDGFYTGPCNGTGLSPSPEYGKGSPAHVGC